MTNLKYIDIESLDAKQLLAQFCATGFVMFVGSAVSAFQPSELPTGEYLTATVAKVLSDPLDSRTQVKAWISSAAFEHIMDGCPSTDVLGENLLQLFSTNKPNPLHDVIAELIADEVIEHIITTNYDTNLETACRVKCLPTNKPQLIVTKSEAENIKFPQAAIFKIHGSVDHDRTLAADQDRTMVYTLRREGELPPWKRRILHRLVGGRRLLICGYSGRDFEICPELPRLNAQIVWNIRKREDLTPNARRVITATDGIILVGDLRKVLAELRTTDIGHDSEPIAAIASSVRSNLADLIFRKMTEWDLDLWRVRILVGIGAATEGMRLATKMLSGSDSDAGRKFDALLNLGRSQFHAGKYRRAIASYRQAAAVAKEEERREWILQCHSDLFEALRCHGNWIKARKELTRMQALISPEEFWAVALRSVLLLRHYYQLVTAIKIMPGRARQIRDRCRELLRVVVQHAKNEQWLELQQAELLADRLDIRFAELYDGPLNPLPSRDGYKQLGYLIAESMAIRDNLVKQRGEASEDVQEMIRALNEAGAFAELWKLVRVASRFKGNSITTAQRQLATDAWRACEYAPLMRLFGTFFH